MTQDHLHIVTATTTAADQRPHYRTADVGRAVSWIPDAIACMAAATGRQPDLIVLPAGYFAINTYSEAVLQELYVQLYDANVRPLGEALWFGLDRTLRSAHGPEVWRTFEKSDVTRAKGEGGRRRPSYRESSRKPCL